MITSSTDATRPGHSPGRPRAARPCPGLAGLLTMSSLPPMSPGSPESLPPAYTPGVIDLTRAGLPDHPPNGMKRDERGRVGPFTDDDLAVGDATSKLERLAASSRRS